MSFFHNLNKRLADLSAKQDAQQITESSKAQAPKSKLAQTLNERDLGKHNNATTGFAALAKKTGGGEKGNRIAGAQLAKMRAKGQVEEDATDEWSDETPWTDIPKSKTGKSVNPRGEVAHMSDAAQRQSAGMTPKQKKFAKDRKSVV